MPKLKTRKAANKRFKKTKTGKFLRRHAKMRHLLECKSKNKKRGLRQAEAVASSDISRVRQMLAGG